jgi:putative hydrolase of the HAD superfamily
MDKPITHLFLDIGGVLATNGWDGALRERTARRFGLDIEVLNDRHHLTYDTYESGRMSLALYLDRIIFFEPRPFTRQDVIRYILEEGKPYPEMLQLVRDLRARYGLKVAVISNEGREIATDRIARFRLGDIADFFIVSAYVHFRKPDVEIYRLALDIAQAQPEHVIYIEDRRMFVEVAGGLGMNAIQHTNVASTKAALARLGLEV